MNIGNVLDRFRRIFPRRRKSVQLPAVSPPATPPKIRLASEPREVTVTLWGKPHVVGVVGYAAAIWGSAQEWANNNLVRCPVCDGVIGPGDPITLLTPADPTIAEKDGVLVRSKEPLVLVGCGCMDCAPVGSVAGTLQSYKRIRPLVVA